MTRLQQVLVSIVLLLAAVLFARAAADTVAAVAAALPALLAAVPAWAWWTLFGVSMSFLCPMKAARMRGRCRSSCSGTRTAS